MDMLALQYTKKNKSKIIHRITPTITKALVTFSIRFHRARKYPNPTTVNTPLRTPKVLSKLLSCGAGKIRTIIKKIQMG